MTIGTLVKKYRVDRELSMQEFANKCGLSKSYISMLEKNINPRNNKPIIPTLDTYTKIAHGMNTELDELLRMLDPDSKIDLSSLSIVPLNDSVRVPVMGRVAAGYGKEAIEEIIDYIEISPILASKGEFFGLIIKGDSMIPNIQEGDIVVVQRIPDAESGDLVIALINGNDATCKRLQKYAEGFALIPNNPTYEPIRFTRKEIEETPVTILGKVVELRRKF